jgi:hypothetical protein
MKKYQIFAASSTALILANYWHIVSSSSFTPRLFDYIAYALFIFGFYKIFKKK